jgi:long-chain acyl-CoA synthetase
MTFNFPDQLRRAAAERGDHLAVTDTERSLTYRDLAERTTRLGHALLAESVAAGDRVAYLGRNAIEFYEFVFGSASIGSVAVPLNWRLTADEIAFLVSDSGSLLVVADEEFLPLVPEGLRTIVLGPEYDAWLAAAPTTPHDRVSGPDDVVLQSYTSGTTSMPKGVLVTNTNYGQTLSQTTTFGIDSDSVVLAVMPNYHVGGSVFAMYGVAVMGSLVVIRMFDAVELPRHIERYGVTHFNIAPTMGSMMVDALTEDSPSLDSLRGVVYGGAPITMKEHARLQKALGAPFVQAYGMTENPCVTVLPTEDHHGDLLRSVGRAVPGVEISIHDTVTGAELGVGEQGEVWIRSAGNTPGYWNRPEATDKLLVGDGWMRSGDGGRLDENGYLYLVDRVTDLIITGGENVYPAEVERVLIAHPEVREISVIGVPHDKWGEAVTAFVVTEESSTLTGEDLIAWSRDKIAGFRRPQTVHVITELPRNAAGKILRRELREKV